MTSATQSSQHRSPRVRRKKAGPQWWNWRLSWIQWKGRRRNLGILMQRLLHWRVNSNKHDEEYCVASPDMYLFCLPKSILWSACFVLLTWFFGQWLTKPKNFIWLKSPPYVNRSVSVTLQQFFWNSAWGLWGGTDHIFVCMCIIFKWIRKHVYLKNNLCIFSSGKYPWKPLFFYMVPLRTLEFCLSQPLRTLEIFPCKPLRTPDFKCWNPWKHENNPWNTLELPLKKIAKCWWSPWFQILVLLLLCGRLRHSLKQ